MNELRIAMKSVINIRNNLRKINVTLVEDSASIDVIQTNLMNLDFVSNEIIYLKSHAVNRIFKDAVIIKNEPLDDNVINDGMTQLHELLEKSIRKLMNDPKSSLYVQ
jgi:hypothetical protein